MRLLSEMAIHDRQVALMKFLSATANRLRIGKHVYVVGGAVRDFALGMPIKDVDIVIDSVSLKGKDSAWFAKKLQRAIPAQTSLVTNNYGVAILSVSGSWMVDGHDLKGEVIEIANAREESYGGDAGKGYKPSEVSAANIKKDAYRREFTFNTLMWRLADLAKGPDKAEIIDITGCGKRDLQRGEMACPSDPDKTFRDDPTRMLRAIKFLVRYDWKITPEVRSSIRRNASLLKKVPHEAIVNLLLGSILKEKTYKKALKEMQDLGLLAVVADMARSNKAMRNTLRHWVGNKKVQFLFALIDAGLPVGTRVDFLSGVDQKRLRQAVIGMRHGSAEQFLDILRQPGKLMNTRELMSALKIKGRSVGQLADIARSVLLNNPELMHDSDGLTQAVLMLAKKKGIQENVSMRVLRSIRENRSQRCIACKGPAHEATGWVLRKKPETILCGRCAKEFADWYKKRQAQMGSVPSKLRKKYGKDMETFQMAMAKSIKVPKDESVSLKMSLLVLKRMAESINETRI